MSSVAVVTSVYGAYDAPVAPVPQTVECDWIMVTDRMPTIRGEHPWPWKVIEEPRPGLHPRLAAKVAKCRPDRYTDAEVTIWVDGHLHITDPRFVAWAVAGLTHPWTQLAQLPHPQRRTIADEANLSAHLVKYAGLPTREQVAHYLEAGYPDGWGLWATGLIVRRSTPQMRLFGDRWLAEQVRWTWQDQLSEAPVLHRLGLRPADLDGPLVGHPMFELAPHADGTL